MLFSPPRPARPADVTHVAEAMTIVFVFVSIAITDQVACAILGTSSAEVERQRVEVAQRFAREYEVFVILKGHRTLVAAPDGQVYVNPTGNPGMASGGAGDVLTGLVAAAVAQWGASALGDALCLAVYLHGLAGDLAAVTQGEQALIASDIIEALPRAWKALGEKIERDVPGSYYVVP